MAFCMAQNTHVWLRSGHSLDPVAAVADAVAVHHSLQNYIAVAHPSKYHSVAKIAEACLGDISKLYTYAQEDIFP